jgi:hypothetical protein
MYSKTGGRRLRSKVAACVVLCLCLISCDAFTVREAIPPEETSSPTDIVTAYQPTLVISNLVNSLEDKNTGAYNELFAEDFVFIADPSDVIDLETYYPGALSDWDRDVEQQVAQRLLDRGQTANILLSFDQDAETVTDETDSTYVVQEDYRLRVVDQEGVLESHVGTAVFYLRLEEDGLWYMHEWQDFRPESSEDDGKDTWGMLKGEIRSTI